MNSRRYHSITSSARASSEGRDFEAKRLGGREVDYQVEARRLLHWQVAGFSALENAGGIDASAAIGVGLARAIAHQTADLGVIGGHIARRQGIAVGKRDQKPPPVEEDRPTAHEQRAGAGLDDGRKGGIELGFAVRPSRSGSSARWCGRPPPRPSSRTRVQAGSDSATQPPRQLGNQLVQQLQPLGHQIDEDEGHAGDVAAGPVEAGDQAGPNRIAARHEHDRHCRRGDLGDSQRRDAVA